MKTFFRYLRHNPLYTIINVVGLAVSLMFVILIGDYTWSQFSVDNWHNNKDRIYLMGCGEEFYMWPDVAAELEQAFPDIEKTCSFISRRGTIRSEDRSVKGIDVPVILLTDPSFFDFFDFKLLEGDRATLMDTPDKCVITEDLANELFPGKDPVGEALRLIGEQDVVTSVDRYDTTLVYTVSGVIKSLDKTVFPNETKIIANMARAPQVMGYEQTDDLMATGTYGGIKTFIMSREGSSIEDSIDDIDRFVTGRVSVAAAWDWHISLTPLDQVMFSPLNDGSGLIQGDKNRLRILLSAVLALLFFAMANYINLTVANTGFRAKEIAARKILGHSDKGVFIKLIGESILMVLLSFLIGLVLAFAFQEKFSELFGGRIDLGRDITVGTVSSCAAFIVLLGAAAGTVPSLQISRFKPVDVVKGAFRYHSKMVLYKVFVVLQNIITVVMLVSALVILLQFNHLVKAPMGFNYRNMYYLVCPDDLGPSIYNELNSLPYVEEIATVNGTFFTGYNTSMITRQLDNGNRVIFRTSRMDKDAMDMYGLELIRDYGNSDGAYYVTEHTLQEMGMGLEDREIKWKGGQISPIAGVFADFHIINVTEDYHPFLIEIPVEGPVPTPVYLVRTNGRKDALERIRDIYRELGANEDYIRWYASSMQEDIEETYEDSRNTLDIISLFALVSGIISILGFVGMSLFFIRQRKKEIGVRTIMGGTHNEITVQLLKTFCAPLLLSFVIAVPLAWYLMRGWLSDFSYRIKLSPWIFILACAASLAIAVLSVLWQIRSAVRQNPVESISNE